jgi:hypothetical protein
MRPHSELDEHLDALTQAVADLGTVLGFRADLLRRAERLEPLLLNELRALRPRVDAVIASLEQALEGDQP